MQGLEILTPFKVTFPTVQTWLSYFKRRCLKRLLKLDFAFTRELFLLIIP